MGRFRESYSDDRGEPGIDMSPLIDCVFILLIFFIVTTVFVEETGVTVNKPDIGGEALDKNSILIAVTNDNKIIYDSKAVSSGEIRQIVKDILEESPDTPVIIQGDEGAKHGVVQEVHQAAKDGGAGQVSI